MDLWRQYRLFLQGNDFDSVTVTFIGMFIMSRRFNP